MEDLKATLKMSKWQLVDHICREHPELVWPDRKGLSRCRKDELVSMHLDLHRQSGGAVA